MNQNKLIVDFMGEPYAHLTFENRTTWWSARSDITKMGFESFDVVNDIPYQTSYDWIFPVWIKFRDIDSFTIEEYKNRIEYISCKNKIADLIPYISIDKLYEKLVQGITWYNSIKQ